MCCLHKRVCPTHTTTGFVHKNDRNKCSSRTRRTPLDSKRFSRLWVIPSVRTQSKLHNNEKRRSQSILHYLLIRTIGSGHRLSDSSAALGGLPPLPGSTCPCTPPPAYLAGPLQSVGRPGPFSAPFYSTAWPPWPASPHPAAPVSLPDPELAPAWPSCHPPRPASSPPPSCPCRHPPSSEHR
jgi:hypothetical protein